MDTVLNEKYRQAAKLLEKADLADSPQQEKRLLDEALALTQELLEADPENADFQHLAGVVWYNYPGDDHQRVEQAHQHLQQALQRDPNHHFARVYLGYLYFDQAKYEDALSTFQKVDACFFSDLDQRWRNLKTEELSLVCRLEIGPGQVAPREIKELAARYIASEPAKAAMPSELVRCVAALMGTRDYDFKGEVATSIMAMIRALEYDEVFASELGLLEAHGEAAV